MLQEHNTREYLIYLIFNSSAILNYFYGPPFHFDPQKIISITFLYITKCFQIITVSFSLQFNNNWMTNIKKNLQILSNIDNNNVLINIQLCLRILNYSIFMSDKY